MSAAADAFRDNLERLLIQQGYLEPRPDNPARPQHDRRPLERFARRAGTSRAAIHRILSGQSIPGLGVAQRIANALEIPLPMLLGGAGDEGLPTRAAQAGR